MSTEGVPLVVLLLGLPLMMIRYTSLFTSTLLSSSILLIACDGTTPEETALDADDDKVADAIGSSVDLDMDGIADLYDINGDGTFDGIGVDTDGDGFADAIGIDTDDDGILDALDLNGDGKPDSTDQVGNANPATGGSGSAPGTGGQSGTGSAASTGGNQNIEPGSGCADADVLCVDFEDTSDGTKPTGSPWLADGCTDSSYKGATAAGAGLMSSNAYVTSNASASANTCALVYDLNGLDDFWVTTWVKISGTSPDMQHEVTFFELGEVLSDDPELRVGYRGDSSCGNAGQPYQGWELGATKGPGGEFTGCTGSKTLNGIPVADEWYCLEVHVNQAGSSMISNLYVDSVKQDYLVHSQPKTEVEGLFKANYLKVGMQSYSGTFDGLALDDVSISTTRLPCPSK